MNPAAHCILWQGIYTTKPLSIQEKRYYRKLFGVDLEETRLTVIFHTWLGKRRGAKVNTKGSGGIKEWRLGNLLSKYWETVSYM